MCPLATAGHGATASYYLMPLQVAIGVCLHGQHVGMVDKDGLGANNHETAITGLHKVASNLGMCQSCTSAQR
jgi:hypothetical protein